MAVQSSDHTFNLDRAAARPSPAFSTSEWISVAELSAGAQHAAGMVVSSAEARRMLAMIDRFAPYKTAVLVHGESGVGKELISRAIHERGPAPAGPFVTFNCSNLVESLAESQLFGHVKGAFTDAREDSRGYFRSANGGTLFLDEIGELPLKLQPKLLRAVEMHEVQPVGSAITYKVNIRLVAATNRDLRAMVKEGSFRADLYYRLNAAAIVVPPLRERRDAIPALVGHFIGNYNRLFGKNVGYISRDALEALCAGQWPGNVRELSHAVENAMLMAESDRIAISDLPENLPHGSAAALEAEPIEVRVPSATQDAPASYSLESAIERATREALTKAIAHSYGNCVRAAELLGVSRYTVYRMINRYGIESMRRRGRIGRMMAQA
jgi:transcriptional regulator with GAF, ATPase, and Fis domain